MTPVTHHASAHAFIPAALALAALSLTLAACAPALPFQAHTPKPAGASATASAGASGSSTITISAPAAWKIDASAPQMPAVITSIAFASTDPAQGYLCAQNEDPRQPAPGLFKTQNAGALWLHVVTPNPGLPCSVFLDPNDPNDLFIQQIVSTPTGTGAPLQAAFWRSRDGGATWSQLSLVPNTDGWDKLVIIGSRLFALAHPVYYGGGFPPCGPGTPPPAQYTTPKSLVYVSDDGGLSWNVFGSSLLAQALSVTDLTTDGQSIYVQTHPVPTDCANMLQPVTWRHLNADGATWSIFPTPSVAINSNLTFWPSASSGASAVVAFQTSQEAPMTIAVSADNGSAWTTLPALTPPDGLITANFDGVAMAPSGRIYAQLETSSGQATSYPGAITFVLDPSQAHPFWKPFAVLNGPLGVPFVKWAPTWSGDSLTMWSIFPDSQSAYVASLPMP